VESRRVNGKPRPVPIAYLGKAADLLARLQATDALRLQSKSHGAVAALFALATELDLPGTIDRHLRASGRRIRPSMGSSTPSPPRAPLRHDGLSVGQSLTLVAIGRACRATSKRAFAQWAGDTTLGELVGCNLDRLTSQHFWDQMDQVPIEAIDPIEREFVGRAIERFKLRLDALLYDATNFFTFIASTNGRPKLPARGHQKQKRDDLRQVGVALLCSRKDGIPLFHKTYGGQVADAVSFREMLPAIQKRLGELGTSVDSLTLVYDKGNVSRSNQKQVDDAGLHYVAALTVASQRALVAEANAHLESVDLGDGETVMAYRARKVVWGKERALVVLVSERLRQGQMRGILQHVEAAKRWLSRLAATLQRGKQRRSRARIEEDIAARLRGRQRLNDVLRVRIDGEKSPSLVWEFDQASFDALANSSLGRLVLVTDRDAWSTAEIIRAYRSQADIEAVFAHLKDPHHLALRPQFHWTDQKLHVHVFTCLLGYLLARLLHLRARAAGVPHKSPEALIDALARIRRTRVARSTTGTGKFRVTTQLEEIEPSLEPLLAPTAFVGVYAAAAKTPGQTLP
jgi:transposase